MRSAGVTRRPDRALGYGIAQRTGLQFRTQQQRALTDARLFRLSATQPTALLQLP